MKHIFQNFAVSICLTLPVQGFSDTLSEIFDLSVQNDPQLRAASAAYMAGKESENISRAGLLPQVAVSAEYSETDEELQRESTFILEEIPVNSVTDRETDTDSTTYALSVSQPVFDLPAWYDYKGGKLVSEQARLQFQLDQQDLIVRVAKAYFGVLKASENLTTAIAEEEAMARQLEQTRQRYEVGLLPITDVHEAQSAYDNTKVNTLLLRGLLQNSFESLEVLTGQPHYQLAALKEDFPASPPDANREEWVKVALENNLQLRISQTGRDAARQNADARKYEHLPTVTASFKYQDVDQDGTFDDNNTTLKNAPESLESQRSTVAINLNWPIFTGGLVSAQRRQASQQYIQADETANYALRNTTQEARTAHLDVITTSATVSARDQAVTSANSALEATQAGYDVGTRNIVDVLIAQRNLFQATRDYANGRYDYIASSIYLKLVSGQLSPDDIYQLNAWLDTSKLVTPSPGQ